MAQEQDWDLEIRPQKGWLELNLRDIWQYRDLLFTFIQRDVTTTYKQTILGPLWFFIQPILTALMFTFVFGRLAKISTDGIPPILFYMSGTILWSYFAETLTKISGILVANARIYGKVYFPRLILPLSTVVSGLVRLGIQLLLLLLFVLYYAIKGNNVVNINSAIIFFPILILMIGSLGLGLGLIISSLTVKYRDLVQLMGFGVQLLMYITPVIYPTSILPAGIRAYIWLNPMATIIETFKYSILGVGQFDLLQLSLSAAVIAVFFIIGLILFNRTEKSFVDTI
jgi:lipopolysaccharide transport system permease protein